MDAAEHQTGWISEYEQAIRSAGIPMEEYPLSGYNYMAPVLEALREGRRPPTFDGDLRFGLIRKYGFAIPSQAAMEMIRKEGEIVEVGAGNGYLAYEANRYGASVLPTDADPPEPPGQCKYKFERQWMPVLRMPAIDAITLYSSRTLMFCWPDYSEPWATEALKVYRGTRLIYIGEFGGCCADDEFFEVLEKDWEDVGKVMIPQWSGIHDYMAVFQRKS